jgi:hypothetical protein
MSLVKATTGTVVQTATVASGLAAFPLTSSESLSINAAGNGLIFYQSGGTLIYRIFSASTSAFTLGTAQSATLPVGGLVNVDVASAVLPNGNIAAAVSGTNGARQYVLLLDINPATGTVGNSVTLLDQSIAGVSGLSSTDFFTSETGWRLPIDISILGSEIVVAYRDAAKDGVGITSLSYSAASLNTSPVVANLIPDRTVAEDTAWSYQVPANTFTDADGNTLAYTASLASGAALPSWLSFNASTRTLSGTPPLNFNGNLDLRVTASDGSSSVSDDFRLTVTPFNDAPVVANAIADQAVAEDTAWSYVVPANAFSDVDNASLTLSAMLGNGAALPSWLSFNGATRTFSGTPPLNFNGNIDLRVTASDGSASVSDDFRLTVTPVNDAPVITGTAPLRFSINENVASVGSLSVSDPDGSNLTFSISGGRNAALFSINSSTGAISFSSLPDFENPFTGLSNSYSFTARVSDGLSFSERNVIVDVLNTKEAIDVVIDSNFLGSISTGVPITGWSDWTNAGVTKSEAPGLVSGLVANIPVGGDLFQWFDKLAPGSYQISFLAKNDSSSAAVLVYGAQQKAGISVNTLFSLGLGSKVYLQPNADFVRVNLNFTVNSNVTFDVNELYFSNSYNAPESSIADSINPPGTIIRVAEVTLSRLSNIAPVVANLIPDRTVAEDAAWSYQVPASTFSDADGNTLTYTASLASGASLPSWLTFNASTRTFSGTPPLNFNGNIDLRVTASDGTASVSDEFRLTVTPDTGLTPYFLYNVSNGAFFWVTSALLPTTGTRVLEPAETGLDSRLTLSPDGSVTITDVRGIGLLFNVGYGDDLTYIKTLSNQPNVAEFPNTFNPNSAVAPTLKSNGGGDSASLSVIENISDVTSLIATDYNKGDVLVYSIIGGVDRSFFTIDAATGAIRFITAPDFERPTDSGGNNIYDVEVQVSDGVLFDRMTLSISVLNVSELGG